MKIRLNDTTYEPQIAFHFRDVRLVDPSLFAILASNLFTIVLAVNQGWPLSEIMWIYWAQSVIIGVTNFLRLRNLKEFSTTGLTMNGEQVPETSEGKHGVANFFAVHYGIFHFVYMAFLWEKLNPFTIPIADLLLILVAIGFFGASHFYSLHYNQIQDLKQRKPNIGSLMLYPYLRIIPMHLTIVIGDVVAATAFWLFMGLKTLADIGMHMIEHALFRQDKEGVRIKDTADLE